MDDQVSKTMLTTREAADLLGLSKRTLEGWRFRGGGPPYHHLAAEPGARPVVRYRRMDLEAFLANGRVDTEGAS